MTRISFPLLSSLLVAAFLHLTSTAHCDDWQHWRGNDRNDITTENSGWDGKTWVRGDLWQISVGEGGSAPIVVGDRVCFTGWSNNRDSVICVDAATGKELWRQSYASPRYGRHAIGDQSLYSGACSTPEYDAETGLLFTLSIDGELNAWDTQKNGERRWGINVYDQYGAQRRPEVAVRKKTRRDYGYTTSPLVVGEQLIVEVGGTKGNLVAFDKRRGKELWVSENQDEAGHTGGPVPMTVQGVPCVAVLTLRNLVVTRTDGKQAGRTVAVYPWTTDYGNNIPTPAVFEDSVIISTAYNHAAMCRVRVNLKGAEKVWENNRIATAVCSPVIHNSRIYWAWRGVHCVDFETGKEFWKGGNIAAPGSVIVTGDDRLIVYGNKGDLSLVETAQRSPNSFTQVAATTVFKRTDAWPHVVLSNGRIICRDRGGDVRCLSVSSDIKLPEKINVTSKPAPSKSKPRPVRTPANLDLSNWPGKNDAELLFGWKRGAGKTGLQGSIAGAQVRLIPRGAATFDSAGSMVVKGGSFNVEGATVPLLNAARKSNELTIEAILTTQSLRQTGPARIISFSSDGYHRNFSLVQERDQLRLRLRTPKTGMNGINPETTLGVLPSGTATHVLVTYRHGELVAYLNGKEAHRSDRVTGDFSNWDDRQQLVFGAEFQDGRDWAGTFDGIALLTRFVGPEEAASRYESAFK